MFLPNSSLSNFFEDDSKEDMLDVLSQLSAEEKMIISSARAFAQDKLFPGIKQAFREEIFDRSLFLEFGKMGFLGIMTAEKYGGAGLSYVSYGLVAREIERVDSGYRSAFSVQNSLVMYPIEAFGSEEQKTKWLSLLARGEKVGCFGLTEPESGSDPASLKTHVIKRKDRYILNGTKLWITNAQIADVAVVWAKDEDGTLLGFLVEKGMPGFSAHPILGKMSLRASLTGELVFEEVELPLEARLPLASGFKAPFACLNKARYGIAWGVVGAAEDCWRRTRHYVLERKQFGKPLAANQLIQYKLALMQTEITLALQGALALGRMLERGKSSPAAISLMKRNNVLKALDIARLARDMHGANGIVDDYHVIRHLLNLETVNTYEGTSDVHALILGREQTGISAF